MALAERQIKPDPAAALHRLLSDSARSRAALGACGFPLAMLDAASAGRQLSYVNRAFEHFFGYRADEALGCPLAALLFRGDEPLVHRLLAESGARWELRAWAKDGSVRHVQLALDPVHDADGQLTHWVAAFSDRTEVEKMRAELDKLKALAALP